MDREASPRQRGPGSAAAGEEAEAGERDPPLPAAAQRPPRRGLPVSVALGGTPAPLLPSLRGGSGWPFGAPSDPPLPRCVSRRPPAAAAFSCPAVGCAQVFDSLASCEHHYGLLHRSACSACQRAFPSAHLLHLHLLEWHDALFGVMAEKRSLYQCLVESCPEKFKNSKERKEHLVRVHCYPSDYRFDKPVKAKRSPSRESAFLMDVWEGEDCREPAADDAMEVGPSKSTEEKPPQPGAEDTPAFPPPERRLYSSR
uniref:Zinc finger protein 511 n=1 Tax=Podarcis muralis TaxID=64176 RepID=A0A670HLZ7_PODMU